VVLKHTTLWDDAEDEEGITVTIGNGPPDSAAKGTPAPVRRKGKKP
jgi:hypothetical protein